MHKKGYKMRIRNVMTNGYGCLLVVLLGVCFEGGYVVCHKGVNLAVDNGYRESDI